MCVGIYLEAALKRVSFTVFLQDSGWAMCIVPTYVRDIIFLKESLQQKPLGDYLGTTWRPEETSWSPVGDQLKTRWRPVGDPLETRWRPVGDHSRIPLLETNIILISLEVKAKRRAITNHKTNLDQSSSRTIILEVANTPAPKAMTR